MTEKPTNPSIQVTQTVTNADEPHWSSPVIGFLKKALGFILSIFNAEDDVPETPQKVEEEDKSHKTFIVIAVASVAVAIGVTGYFYSKRT